MATNPTGITDATTAVVGEIVGNEQWASDEGISGPDPEQWDDVEAREETGFEPGEPGVLKGPDPAQHPDREV